MRCAKTELTSKITTENKVRFKEKQSQLTEDTRERQKNQTTSPSLCKKKKKVLLKPPVLLRPRLSTKRKQESLMLMSRKFNMKILSRNPEERQKINQSTAKRIRKWNRMSQQRKLKLGTSKKRIFTRNQWQMQKNF